MKYKSVVAVALTNDNGEFESDFSFSKAVSYQIIWEQRKWDIRNGLFGQATYNGPTQRSDWNFHIGQENPRLQNISAVHRALMTYYYGDIDGMIRIGNSESAPIKIAYRHNTGGNSKYIGSEWHLGILAGVRIKGLDEKKEHLPANEIYRTTIHELSHASHAFQTSLYNLINIEVIREGWAEAVAWHLTRKEYRNAIYQDNDDYRTYFGLIQNGVSAGENPNWFNHQNWSFTDDDKNYSPLFIDLIDDLNQNEWGTKEGVPNDNVKGYTIAFLNRALGSASYARQLKEYLLVNPKPIGVTNQDIEKLFIEYLKL